MPTFNLKINNENHTVEADADTPVLWVLRDVLGYVGTKFGCGIGQCGACTIHLDGSAARACVTPLSAVENRSVTTIEGLATPAGAALVSAWEAEQVPQCGYCQSGQIMQAATLLEQNAQPSESDIVSHMDGHLCRCMAYPRIKKAIVVASQAMTGEVSGE